MTGTHRTTAEAVMRRGRRMVLVRCLACDWERCIGDSRDPSTLFAAARALGGEHERRHAPVHELAWDALRETGRDVDDYMLMDIAPTASGALQYHFKRRDTRDYLHLPPYPGGCPAAGKAFHRECRGG